VEVIDAFRTQARACVDLGSAMYGGLLDRLADELEQGDPVLADVLRGHERDPGPSALALRLLGAVHRLVLQGDAPELEAFYPTTGGRWDLHAAWPGFVMTLTKRNAELRPLLDRAPQTNEVGRASALIGGLLHVAERHRLPIRLVEIGSSGGLNLAADQFRYVHEDGTSWGPVTSPVVLDPAWRGAPLPSADLSIVDRVGSDLAPIDVTTPEGQLRLMSYVWPDQPARFERLRGAFAVVAAHPAPVEQRDAVSMVGSLSLVQEATTVLWHSVMWQYLSSSDRTAVAARIAALGGSATIEAPFAHLFMEPTRRTPTSALEFLVVLEAWPGGERRVLGPCAPHGLPTTWE